MPQTFDVKDFITKSRAQNIPDEATYKYLQGKGLISGQTPMTTQQTPERGLAGQILPTLGTIGGAIGGGALGGLAGEVAGAGAGAAFGETAQQGIEMLQGKRQALSPKDVAIAGTEGIAAQAAIPFVGPALKGVGEAVFKTAIPLSAKEAVFEQAYKAGETIKKPLTTALTALEKGLMGTESQLGVKAKQGASELWNKTISPALSAVKEKINIKDFFKEAEQNIIKENPEPARQKDLLKALQSMKDDYKGIKDITYEQLQTFKEQWAKFVPQKAYKGEDIAGVYNEVKNTLSGIARDKIYTKLGDDIKQAYLHYGNFKNLEELGQKAMTGGKLKGGFGGFVSGVKDLILTPVLTYGGQALYRTGQGMEFIGEKGAKTIGDLLKGLVKRVP